MEEKLSGIVLSSINYGENDKILNIFTLEKGIVCAKIKGVKKAGAKLKFASEPFCFAEYVFLTSQGKRSVKTASLIDSFYPLREDIVKFYSAGTAIEFVKRFYKEEIVSPKAFVLLAETLKQLAYGDDAPRRVIAKFLFEALKNVGYGLDISDCICGKPIKERPSFSVDYGRFYCMDCAIDGCKEVKKSTYLEIQSLHFDEKTEYDYVGALRLFEYYLKFKAEESLNALSELNKL